MLQFCCFPRANTGSQGIEQGNRGSYSLLPGAELEACSSLSQQETVMCLTGTQGVNLLESKSDSQL